MSRVLPIYAMNGTLYEVTIDETTRVCDVILELAVRLNGELPNAARISLIQGDVYWLAGEQLVCLLPDIKITLVRCQFAGNIMKILERFPMLGCC